MQLNLSLHLTLLLMHQRPSWIFKSDVGLTFRVRNHSDKISEREPRQSEFPVQMKCTIGTQTRLEIQRWLINWWATDAKGEDTQTGSENTIYILPTFLQWVLQRIWRSQLCLAILLMILHNNVKLLCISKHFAPRKQVLYVSYSLIWPLRRGSAVFSMSIYQHWHKAWSMHDNQSCL